MTNAAQSSPFARHRARGAARRSLALSLLIAALVFVPWVSLAWFFGALSGDLARIGAWPERHYGWHAPQPELAVRSNLAGRAAPGVLVLGDSFSMGNVWQSVAAGQLGMATFTLGYDGHGCLPEFAALAGSPEFAGARHVVVETIERYLVDRFEQFARCGAAGPVVFDGPAGVTPASRPAGWPSVDWRYIAKTAMNTQQVRQSPDAVVRGPEVVNVPLAHGDRFSNRTSSRLLYYAGDDAKAGWTDARVQAAARHARELQEAVERTGKTFTLLVVPDKSTVYRELIASAAVVKEGADVEPAFRAAGVHLLWPREPLTRAAAQSVDLYLPDDTHLSPRGFEALGRLVAAELAARR